MIYYRPWKNADYIFVAHQSNKDFDGRKVSKPGRFFNQEDWVILKYKNSRKLSWGCQEVFPKNQGGFIGWF
jgi:hypothetical protein